MTIDRNLASALIAGLALFASVPASAQQYVHQPLDVLSAQNVLSTPAQGQLPYAFRSDLYLVHKGGLNEKARKRLFQTPFEVRIFRLGDDGKPTPWKTDQDNCDIYLTLVFKNLKFNGSRIDLGPLSKFHWLRQNQDGSVGPGRFLMVVAQETRFESTSKLGRWEIFRLQRDTRAEYFQGAVEIEVSPVSGGGSPLPWPDDETKTKQALDSVAKMISTAYYCYQAVRIADIEGPLHMASMACGATPPAPEDPARQPHPADTAVLRTPTNDKPAALN